MRKALMVAAALSSLMVARSGRAADLPSYTKAPVPMITPVYDWAGFYVGLNGGGGTSRQCWDLVGAGAIEGCHNATGGTAGGLFGYRWQSTNWVFGIEFQGNWADFSGSNISNLIPAQQNKSRIDAFGLFTGQVGYAWNNTLLYFKGGAAVVGDNYDINAAPGFAGAGARLADDHDDGAVGGVLGAGIEYGFAPSWSVGIEYDHIFLGGRTVTTTTTPGASLFQSDRITQDVDTGLFRVNYKFGGPDGLAKY